MMQEKEIVARRNPLLICVVGTTAVLFIAIAAITIATSFDIESEYIDMNPSSDFMSLENGCTVFGLSFLSTTATRDICRQSERGCDVIEFPDCCQLWDRNVDVCDITYKFSYVEGDLTLDSFEAVAGREPAFPPGYVTADISFTTEVTTTFELADGETVCTADKITEYSTDNTAAACWKSSGLSPSKLIDLGYDCVEGNDECQRLDDPEDDVDNKEGDVLTFRLVGGLFGAIALFFSCPIFVYVLTHDVKMNGNFNGGGGGICRKPLG